MLINNRQEFFERLRSNVYDHFQYLFYSGDLGTIKPNDEAFILPFEELNKLEQFKDYPIELEDIVFLDDQAENIIAAKESRYISINPLQKCPASPR